MAVIKTGSQAWAVLFLLCAVIAALLLGDGLRTGNASPITIVVLLSDWLFATWVLLTLRRKERRA